MNLKLFLSIFLVMFSLIIGQFSLVPVANAAESIASEISQIQTEAVQVVETLKQDCKTKDKQDFICP